MRRSAICAAILGALILTVGATGASAKTPLKLKQEGVETPVHEVLGFFFTTHGCAIRELTELVSNDRPKDVANGLGFPELVCFAPPAVGINIGELKDISYASNGQVKVSAKGLTVTEPGECTYALKKIGGKVAIPGFSLFEATASGKLLHHTAGCEKTESFVYVAGLETGVFSEALEVSF